MKLISSYINYGIPSEIANTLVEKNISLTTFRNTSKKNLKEKYELDEELIELVKKYIVRKPIPDDTLNILLEKSNFTCCICHGIKGKSYVVHHIEEYSKTQDNNYSNLAVLCPTCHDLAHGSSGLATSINKDQIYKSKYKWEKQVEKIDVEAASRNGEILDVDFVNIPRITELAYNLFNKIPKTNLYDGLIRKKLVDINGELNREFIQNQFENRNYFFDFFFSSEIKYHYYEIFKEILLKLNFKNLDDLLNLKTLKSNDIIGTYCFYVGGLYGKSPNLPINNETPATHLYFKRRYFFVEWTINPIYITSMTAITRFSRSIFLIYGKIRNVSERKIKNKDYIYIDIRPYLAGPPTKAVDRTPIVHWARKYEELEDQYDDDDEFSFDEDDFDEIFK